MPTDPHQSADLEAIDSASGAWTGRDEDGVAYVERLRSGRRLDDAARHESVAPGRSVWPGGPRRDARS